MSLADRIAAARPARKVTLDIWLRCLDEKDTTEAIKMATDPAFSNVDIMKFLDDEGVAVGKDRIAAWRKSHGFQR